MEDVPLSAWVDLRDHYLDELMGLEGKGRFQAMCARCGELEPAFRCKDCMHGALYCQDCMVVVHSSTPLHVVEVSILYITLFSRH